MEKKIFFRHAERNVSKAHFYPTPLTLIPSAIMCGLAGGPLWSAGQVYVTQISKVHAELSKQDEIKMVGIYLGVFFMNNSAMVIGNAIAAVITVIMDVSGSQARSSGNGNHQHNITTLTANYYDEEMMIVSNSSTEVYQLDPKACGDHYTFHSGNSSSSENNRLSKSTMFTIVGVFIGLQVVAIIMSWFLPDVRKLQRGDLAALDEKDVTLLTKEEEAVLDENENSSPQKRRRRLPISIYAIFLLLLQDATGVLMIMITLNFGFLHSFVAGDFTRSWVTCTFGVEKVMTLMALFGVVTTFASAISGQLLRVITLNKLLWTNMVLEVSILMTFLFWKPEKSQEWLFYLITAASALCFGIYRSQVPNVYSVLWKDNLPPAMALLGTCEAIAYALMFGLGDIVPFPKIILTLSCCLLGTIAYRFAWSLRKNI